MSQLRVQLGSRGYPVYVGRDLRHRAHELIPDLPKAEKIAVFYDEAIEPFVDVSVRRGWALTTFGARGEQSKNIATAERAWHLLAAHGFHRNDLVLAFGGGVVGDLAGFVAATFHRGMPWVVMPTTLLGMVDASIGGKTAVDLPEGKNLVGAFHQPLCVIADTSMLRTLPDEVFATGMAEVIKHGFISELPLRDFLTEHTGAIRARDPETLERLVADAAEVKVHVVSQDETEQGARAHLNYGHTLGHALEALGGYARWTHGQAVAIGMMFAAHLAAELGYGDRVAEHAEALGAFDLPIAGAAEDFDAVLDVMAKDKKYERGMRFVVLEDFGKPLVVADVPESAMRNAYEAVR